MLGSDGEYPAGDPKDKNRRKSTVNYSLEKPTFFNFMNLLTIFCLRFSQKMANLKVKIHHMVNHI